MPPLPFTAPWLLAPMEGVTDACFRDLVLARHTPSDLGGAFTEFVRVVDHTLPRKILRRHLGAERFPIPVGLQLMGTDLDALAATAARAVEAGAPLIDLNFGCPAKGALRGCAGSAMLKDPASLERVVAACVRGVAGTVPVSAKIRAGYDDAERVEELARSVEAGGAALLTIHCRTRREGYQEEVDWSRIARAVDAVSIPVCGNGGVGKHSELQRMRDETACAYVMIGQAALADPWIFSGHAASASEAVQFLLEYGKRMQADGASPRGAAARVKQLLRTWTAGGLVRDERERTSYLRETDPLRLFERLDSALVEH